MKNKYITFSLLVLTFQMRAQKNDSLFQKQAVPKTDIELVYSHYIQDGNNSAVTGGIGTERLTVYAPVVNINHQFRKNNTIALSLGADVISSASTDRIDFVLSSASAMDTRAHIDLGYKRQIGERVAVSGSTGLSIESDYLSFPVSLGLDISSRDKLRNIQAVFRAYFDDLRWGRINPDYYRPVRLIYPEELRYREWYDDYKRNSYNLQLGVTQVINKKLIVGVFAELDYQHGLLATPFHRVYFTDNSLKVENLPQNRVKFPLGLRGNYFWGNRNILKTTYSFYVDNFGITGNAVELENAVKVSSKFTLAPFLRFYIQQGSRYFKPYKEHDPGELFYTSDYDLSGFRTYKLGANIKYRPAQRIIRRIFWDELNFSYAFYYRSNHLYTHILSVAFKFSSKGKSQPEL